MRTFFAFVLLLAVFSAAKADNCVVDKCSAQLELCMHDTVCASALRCAVDCQPTDTACLQTCASKAAGNAAFTALASCAAQCIPTAGTQALGLIAEFEQAIQVDAPFKKHCSFLKKAACAVGIAGAISACGGPEDLVCILKILSALHGCAECFCKSHCHGACKDLHLC